MMHKTIVAVVACGVLAGLGPEVMAFGGPGGGRRPPAFSDLDADGDGAVTRAEFEAHAQQRASEHFARMDSDGDGVVTKEEMEAMRKKRRGGRRPGGRRGAGGGAPGGPQY